MKTGRALPDVLTELKRQQDAKRDYISPASSLVFQEDGRALRMGENTFGIKDIVTHGDFPIVWTNKKYRMVYLNMGHGDESFIDAMQNLLFTNAFRWVAFAD